MINKSFILCSSEILLRFLFWYQIKIFYLNKSSVQECILIKGKKTIIYLINTINQKMIFINV